VQFAEDGVGQMIKFQVMLLEEGAVVSSHCLVSGEDDILSLNPCFEAGE